MPVARRFDHDEARRRYADGERIVDLAREYGVTRNAVARIVRNQQARQNATTKAWRTGVCEDCGGPAMRLIGSKQTSPDGRMLCNRCRGIRRRERFRFDKQGTLATVRCSTVDCANGERWQPPENFTRGPSFHDLREGGIHDHCRACQTRMRRNWRRRNRERENAYQRAYKRRRARSAA